MGTSLPPCYFKESSLGSYISLSVRIRTSNDHGTGCVLATSIASGLAAGLELPDAVAAGRDFVQAALLRSIQLRSGCRTRLNGFTSHQDASWGACLSSSLAIRISYTAHAAKRERQRDGYAASRRYAVGSIRYLDQQPPPSEPFCQRYL